MFDAQLLMGKGTEAVSVYSPWFSRRGDSLIATLDIVALDGAFTTLTVDVFTKNSQDTGDGTNANALVSIVSGSVGPSRATWEGVLEEMVRYKFTLREAQPNWVLFRMLEPAWFDAVKA